MGSKAVSTGRGEFRTETRVLRAAPHPQAALHNNQTGTKVDGLLSVANQNATPNNTVIRAEMTNVG